MSLHLYPKSRMTPSPTNNNSTAGDESSDSENASSSALVFRLKKELKKELLESAKSKREIKELNTQLLQIQDENALLQQKHIDKNKALRKATSTIKELETLCNRRDEEIVDLKYSLEEASVRGCRLNTRLEFFEKERNQLNLEKSQLDEQNAQLEEEVRKFGQNALISEQLLTELEQLRLDNLDLKRKLVAAREKAHLRSTGIMVDEESPDRMLHDQFDQRTTDGVNLHQELIMLGNPLIATISQSSQFPSSGDLLEGHDGDGAVMDSTAQTDKIPVTNSSTQIEIPPGKTITTQTGDISSYHTNIRGLLLAAQRSNASVQTERVPSKFFSTSSTQSTSTATNGTPTAVQPHCIVPHQPAENLTTYVSPPMFQPPSEPNYVVSSSTHVMFWWILVTAVLCLIVAMLSNGGRINITPLVNFVSRGLKSRYNKGMPPY